MVTAFEGGQNFGCDALPEARDCDSHRLSTAESVDSPSVYPMMMVEEPSTSSVRDPRGSDDLGILDSPGSNCDCRCCVFAQCSSGAKNKPDKRHCTLPRILSRACHGNRLLCFGLGAAVVVMVILTTAMTIYYATARADSSEIPVNYDIHGNDLVVILGQGLVVRDVLQPARNFTTEAEMNVLRTLLVQTLDYKLRSIMAKTRLRDQYKGFQIVRLNIEDGTVEYSLVFRGVDESHLLDDLRYDMMGLLEDGSSMDYSILKLDATSLRPSTFTTPTHADLPSNRIIIPLCSDRVIVYNATCYPNVLNHQTQKEAMIAGLHHIQMFFAECSDILRQFWCSIFTPDCTHDTPLPPCRSFCQAVVTDCPNLRADIDNLIDGGCSALPDYDCTGIPQIAPAEETVPVDSCKEVEVDACRSLGFTLTRKTGNLLGQRSASSRHWWQLLEYVAKNSQCSPHLITFGCSVFYPRCTDDGLDPAGPEVERPCEKLCRAVQRDCGFFFSLVGMTFLSDFNCSDHLSKPVVGRPPTCVGSEFGIDSTDVQCGDDQFKCDASQCVSAKWVCDGRGDCNNGKDEENCAKCSEENSFRCKNGKCVPLRSRCDGKVDCYSAEDEDSCVRVSSENGAGGNQVQIYNPVLSRWEPVCVPAVTASLTESLCNINRFMLFQTDNRWPRNDTSVVAALRHSSRCDQHPTTVVRCNYSACIDGPRLGEVSRFFESSSKFGGALAEGDWPWSVSFHGGQKRAFYCGGILVADQWVVTAAHCVGSLTLRSDWTAVIGQSRRTAQWAESRQERTITRIVVHPRYSSLTGDDIALVRLDRPIRFGASVRRLCLPDAGFQAVEGQTCYAGGWGKTTDDARDFSEELRLRQLIVQPVSLCGNEISSDEGRSTVLCTVGHLASDVCKGDSGSAVLCEPSSTSTERDRLVFAGIVSRGRECGYPNVSSVQTAVAPFADWIRQEMTSSSSSSSSVSSSSSPSFFVSL